MKMNMSRNNLGKTFVPFLLLVVIIMFSSCRNEEQQREVELRTEPPAGEMQANQNPEVRIFSGDIAALNVSSNQNREASGNISIRVEGNLMRFFVTAEGLEPGIMHMQFLQTSGTNEPVQCPDSSSDLNRDGIIDIDEVSPLERGARIIPLHMGPSTLDMGADTYPSTNVNGQLQFSRTVSMDSLKKAVREQYGIENLDFSNFTYVIQGVDPDTKLTATTATRGGVIAQQSLPVGCAKLNEE